jgi:hypothetical protein
MYKEIKIQFEDLGQDLKEISVRVAEHSIIGTIQSVETENLTTSFAGKFVNVNSISVNGKLEILNFRDKCTDIIKYPIKSFRE